jgi:hypothetical protein
VRVKLFIGVGSHEDIIRNRSNIVFEHVTLLLSFIYVIALTHLLSSTTGLILARDRVHFSPLLALWMILALGMLFNNWLAIWALRSVALVVYVALRDEGVPVWWALRDLRMRSQLCSERVSGGAKGLTVNIPSRNACYCCVESLPILYQTIPSGLPIESVGTWVEAVERIISVNVGTSHAGRWTRGRTESSRRGVEPAKAQVLQRGWLGRG